MMNFSHNNLKYLNKIWALKIVSIKRLFLVCRFLYFIIWKIVVILFVLMFLTNPFLLVMQAFLVDETFPLKDMLYLLILHIFLLILLKFLTYRFLPCFLIYIIKHCRQMFILSLLLFFILNFPIAFHKFHDHIYCLLVYRLF